MSFFPCHARVGRLPTIKLFHAFVSSTASFNSPYDFMSSLIHSSQVFLRLPLPRASIWGLIQNYMSVCQSVMTIVILGDFSASIPVQILATNLTKLAEQFTFSLVSVDPPGLASLKAAATQINFTLPDIGNPGGVFSFGLEMNASYVIRVSYEQESFSFNN